MMMEVLPSPTSPTSPTLSSPFAPTFGAGAALCRDASDVVLATLASYLQAFTTDDLFLKRNELDALRPRTAAEHDALNAAKRSTLTLSRPVPARARTNADSKALTLPPELIAHTLSLAHAPSISSGELYLLHLCSGGTDPATRAFARTLHALAPLPALRRTLLARTTARVGLHAHKDLPDVLARTAPLRLAVLFGVHDERRAPAELAAHSALPVLLEHAERWRELLVEGWDAAADIAFLRASSPALPFVRHLQFLVHSAQPEDGDVDNEAIAAVLAEAKMQQLTSARVSVQYLPAFVLSGVFARVRTLKVHTTAQRSAASLAACLAPLAALEALESLEIVEEGHGYAVASPLEALPGAIQSDSERGPKLLRIPSLRRVRVRGCTSKSAAALVSHLWACAGVEEFAMADSCVKRKGVEGKEKGEELLLAALEKAFPRLNRLESDLNLPSLLVALASPLSTAPSTNDAKTTSIQPAQQPLPLSNLRALALLRPATVPALPARLVTTTLAARRAAGVPVLELGVRVHAPSLAVKAAKDAGADAAMDVDMDVDWVLADASMDDARALRALEAYVPHVVRLQTK